MRYGSGIIRMKSETIIGAFLSGGGSAKDLTPVIFKNFDPRLNVTCMVGNICGKIELGAYYEAGKDGHEFFSGICF
jgi:hypothetical protein